MSSFTETLAEMTSVADSFCQLVDRTGRAPGNWLEMLYELMPRLHAAVTALNGYETGDAPMDGVDLDERFEVYVRLRKALGHRDSYWLEFDASPEEIHMSGSLADDLTDIYFDLLQGLDQVDEAWPQRAAQVWQSTYRLHWGRHLVDAERHLYALKVRNQLSLETEQKIFN